MDNKVIESSIDNVVVQVGTQKIKKRSQLAEVWRRFRRNKSALVGMTMFFILVFAAIFADVISPYDR